MSQTSRLERWWESDVAPHDGKQGRIVSPAGRAGSITCPVCGQNPVVYNGNYFCDGWVCQSPADPSLGECEWALAHPATTKIDRDFCDLVGLDYK